MSNWKIPPRAKILHALSINARKEINWITNSKAKIGKINVLYDKKENAIYFDEKEAYEKGFLSSQALAVLIAKGILPNNEKIGSNLDGFKWDEFDYDNYSEAEIAIKKQLSTENITEKEIDAFIQMFTDKILENGFKVMKIDKKQSSIMGF